MLRYVMAGKVVFGIPPGSSSSPSSETTSTVQNLTCDATIGGVNITGEVDMTDEFKLCQEYNQHKKEEKYYRKYPNTTTITFTEGKTLKFSTSTEHQILVRCAIQPNSYTGFIYEMQFKPDCGSGEIDSFAAATILPVVLVILLGIIIMGIVGFLWRKQNTR